MSRARSKKRKNWLSVQLARRPLPIWVLVVVDLLILGVALNVFALFHHVLPRHEEMVGLRSERAVQPTQEHTAQVSPTPEIIDPPGHFATKFADRFADGQTQMGATGYKSSNIDLRIEAHEGEGVRFYVADFYVKDISVLQTTFANDRFGRGEYERVAKAAQRLGAILAINGDYYGGHSDGIVLRNGTLYRKDDRPERDICVLYWDGSMDTLRPQEFDQQAVMDAGAYQIWNFGPMLLDAQGCAMEEFNSDVERSNPRTALGYFEPGHYCFVVVDGRSSSSRGLTLKELSKLMESLGCAKAYNLDGGESSEMVYAGETVNSPADGGRKGTDAIVLLEP